MHYAKLFLNKIIDSGDASVLARYNIDYQDMHTDIDRRIYRFIEQYAEQNDGQAPSYATVAAEIEGYEYIPDVSDSYDYLARQIKDYSAKQAIIDVHNSGEFERRLNEMPATDFNNWLTNFVDDIKIRTSVRERVGTDIKSDVDKFLAEYERRKLGESFRVWKSKFDAIGEYISGNLYTVYGKSGRGKSVITLEEALYVAQQGANVLIWAMEMSAYELLVRAYTSLSGDAKIANTEIQGVNMDVGFDSRDMRLGTFSAEFEETFKHFVRNINEHLAGNLIIRAVDDADFIKRSLRDLQADIERTNADFVIIDPFYYLDYETNTSRTAGGDAAATSIKLRRYAGTSSAVIVAITQAEETKEETAEDGVRELALPNREDVKKTKQLLEDAYQLIAVDTDYQQGRGIVGVNKGRDGGEGDVTEFIYAPQYGVIEPLKTGEEVIGDFDF